MRGEKKILTDVKTRACVSRMPGGVSMLTEVMKSGEKAEHTELLLCLLWKHC